MISFANTIDIDRAPADVFGYLADLEHVPEWNWAIAQTLKITPGPVGVGTRYRQTRSVPRPRVEELEITGLEPGRRLDVDGTLGPFDAHLTYEVAPAVHGTRLTNAVNLRAPALLGPFGDLLGGRIRASVAENLRVLKALLERGGR